MITAKKSENKWFFYCFFRDFDYTVSVTLRQPEKGGYSMDDMALKGGSETILIVDDHETIWDFLIDVLQKLGYCVLLAENGLDAVEIYRSNPSEIDLVLLDMIMPKCGGHKAFYQLKEIDPNVKVLLSSGFVSEHEVEDLLAQGACGFLPKPHRLPVLIKEIRRILDEAKASAE